MPAPTDAPAGTDDAPDGGADAPEAEEPSAGPSEPGPDEEPAVEATVPLEEPTDGAPTPVAAPAEGPIQAAAHEVSVRPKPVVAKVTPVLAAVAVAWLLKKLFTRNRS